MIGRLFTVVGAHEEVCSDCGNGPTTCLEFHRRLVNRHDPTDIAFRLCIGCALETLGGMIGMLSLLHRHAERARENAAMVERVKREAAAIPDEKIIASPAAVALWQSDDKPAATKIRDASIARGPKRRKR